MYLAWAPFFSGAERALLLTLKSLDPARYRPFVIAGTDGEFAAQVQAAGISCQIQPLQVLDRRRLPQWLRSLGNVLRVCRRIRPAVIHANDMPSFQPGGFAGRLLGLPTVTHIRFPDEAAGFRWFLRPGFRRALFVSEYLRGDALAKAPDLFLGRSDVLYDGVAVPACLDAGARARLRDSLGFGPDATVIAITGQVAEVKGVWDFVEAARVVSQRTQNIMFAVLGDDLAGKGALRHAMEARVNELGIGGQFRFLGFRPNAPDLIAAFDVVAVPSHLEPLGNATLEAMASGRPVVGSRVGGIPEMVVDGETGLLVPPKDPSALADAFEMLARDPSQRQRLGTAGRLRIESHFSLKRHADTLQAVYDGLLLPASGGSHHASA